MSNNICTVLDIGSSKIACIIFEVTSKSDVIKVLGYTTKHAVGLRGSAIENITDATTAISSAVYEAEKQASITVKKVATNISHPFIHSKTVITDSHFGGKQLFPEDLKNITDKVLYSASQPKFDIIHCNPIHYDVDAMKDISEPEYMFVNNLRSYYHIVTMPKNSLELFKQCLQNLHLIPRHCVMSSYASSLACNLNNLCNCIMLDIGGGVSDIAVFGKNSSLLWTGSVFLGGENITKDISECFAISYEEAEKLKILYGNLTQSSSGDLTVIKDATSQIKINRTMLNGVILARIEEMIEITLNKIPEGFRQKTIVLSGGVAKTLGITEFISTRFNLVTKIGVHLDTISGLSDSLRSDLSFTTTIGLMNYYLTEINKPKSFSIKKIFEWMWENF